MLLNLPKRVRPPRKLYNLIIWARKFHKLCNIYIWASVEPHLAPSANEVTSTAGNMFGLAKGGV